MVTVTSCIFTTIQSAAIGLIAERDMGAWALKPDMELIAIGYSVSIEMAVHLTLELHFSLSVTLLFKILY